MRKSIFNRLWIGVWLGVVARSAWLFVGDAERKAGIREAFENLRVQHGNLPNHGMRSESEIRIMAWAARAHGWIPGEPVLVCGTGSSERTSIFYKLMRPGYFFAPSPVYYETEGFPKETRWLWSSQNLSLSTLARMEERRTGSPLQAESKKKYKTPWYLVANVGNYNWLYRREGVRPQTEDQHITTRWAASIPMDVAIMTHPWPGLFQVLGLFTICALLGEGFRRALRVPAFGGAISVTFGVSALVLMFSLADIFQLRAGSLIFTAGIIGVIVFLWTWVKKAPCSRTSETAAISWMEWLGGIALTAWAFWHTASLALTAELQGAPGLGMYGLRAKLAWLLGTLPGSYFHTGGGYEFSYPDYPSGWSALLHATALVGGCWEEHWVKIWPALLAATALWGVLSWMRMRQISFVWGVPVAFFLIGRTADSVSLFTYPDAALLPLSWAGYMLLWHDKRHLLRD